MKFLVTRKTIIKEFAKEIARLQKDADIYYYIKKDKNHSSWLLDQVEELKHFANRLDIVHEVYNEAYKIYDFRNSGKKGYDLVDGKITLVAGDRDLNSNDRYSLYRDTRYIGYYDI